MRAALIGLGIGLLIVVAGGCARKSVPASAGSPKDSVHTADSAAQAAPLLTYEQEQGKFFYTKYCAVCHGDDGKGDGFNAFNLNPKPRDFTDTKIMGGISDQRLIETVREGGRGVNKSPLMPAWGGTLSADQIAYVVEYIKTFAGQK